MYAILNEPIAPRRRIIGRASIIVFAATLANCTSSATSLPTTVEPVVVNATTVPDQVSDRGRIWFVRDARLQPAYRSGVKPETLIEALLVGPTSADGLGVSTAIPRNAALLSLSVRGDVALVDLARGFESGAESLSMTQRVAQIVYTVTEIPGVARVLFEIDGEPMTTLAGDGIDTSVPVGRDDFLRVKPLVLASEPRPGQLVTSPLRIVGENSTFENNVEISLRTSDGRLLLQTFATGTGPIRDGDGQPVWGPFETEIIFFAGTATDGVLALTETAPDGSGRLLADFSLPIRFAPQPARPAGPLEGGSNQPVLVPATGCCDPGPFVLLQSVSTQRLSGFDRVEFELSAELANYHVRYVALPVTQDPSDLPIALQGDAALQISFGATGLAQTVDPPVPAYSGPLRIAVGGGSIIEMVQTGDFEAVSNWTIGVIGTPAFRVTTALNPARLIVDVASPQP